MALMTEEQQKAMVERVTAMALANKAVLACVVANKPVTVDNASLAVARWIDPNAPEVLDLVTAFLGHVDEIIEAGARLSPSRTAH